MALTVLATYDIREDDRRSHVAALLQSFGNRIQKSVFVLMLDADDLSALQLRVAGMVDTRVDSVWFVRQCGTCWAQAETIGQVKVPDKVTHWAVM